jgi:hypothetical protein
MPSSRLGAIDRTNWLFIDLSSMLGITLSSHESHNGAAAIIPFQTNVAAPGGLLRVDLVARQISYYSF